jgi:kynurenine formamidase
MTKFIDLTQTMEDQMPVYPGDDSVSLKQIKFLQRDKYNNHRLETGMHVGTHLDGPMHLTESKTYISELPLESFAGEGCILDVRKEQIITYKPVYEELIPEEGIVLFYTGLDEIYGTEDYYEHHPTVSVELANLLINKHIKLVGMDMPSPDQYPFEIHKLLLTKGILIIENLTNLKELSLRSKFEIMAFPPKLKTDGAMVRVVAKIIE